MFPSGASITNDQSDSLSQDAGGWLQNATYKRQEIDLIPYKHHQKHKKRKSLKSLKRPHSPKSEESNETETAVSFMLDKNGNPAIFEFGCTYEGDVPKFHEDLRVPILGCSKKLRIIDYEPELLKKDVKRSIEQRYFSRKNRKIIAKPSTDKTAILMPESPNNSDRSFYKVLKEGSSILSELVEPSSQHSERIQKVTNLNRAVYDNPKDLNSWLELIESQLPNISDQNEVERSSNHSNSDRFAILDRQLAVLERATENNPGNLRLRLLKAAMYEYATELIACGACRNSDSLDGPTLKDKVAKEWYDLVRVCPQFVRVWRGYLSYLRGRFALFGAAGGDGGQKESVVRIDTLYKRALDTLSGLVAGRIVSHRPTETTADETADLLAEYCHWLSQTGFTERAFAVWQAVIEFTCFCPPHLRSRGLSISYEQRREFRNFWVAANRGSVFGIPGARGWARWYLEQDHGTCDKKVADGPVNIDQNPVLAEIEEDWSPNSSTAEARWNRLTKDWNGVSDAAEDALLNYGANISNNESHNKLHHHSGEGSLSNRRARGLAWLGLEKARESVGWLPADATMDDPSMLEDTEKVPKFEDIEPLLLEVHLDPNVSDETLLQRRKQRLILLFLEFLGVWEKDIARTYELPAELQQLYELSSVSCLQRQILNPRQFGFPWLRPGMEAGGNVGSSVSARMRSVIASSALEQASRLFTEDNVWQSSIKRLRFHNLASQIERLLTGKLITPKTALSLMRKKAKSLLEQSQDDLNLWLAYATALTQTACAASDLRTPLFSEARKIFTSTLRMFPIPAELPTSLEEQLRIFLPRLKILQAFVEFELGVNFPIDKMKLHSRVECFMRVLHLVQHAAIGGSFVPLSETEESPTVSLIPNSGSKLDSYLEMLCRHSVHSSQVDDTAETIAILASLRLYLHLVTQNEANLRSVLKKIFVPLGRFDSSKDDEVGAGYASRRFLRMALQALTATSSLNQRNRKSVINTLLDVMSSTLDTNSSMPPLTSPFEWSHLLPFKVAANCGAYLDKTCTVGYQRRLQGLLPPMILASIESRLTENVRGVCASITRYLMTTCNRDTVRPNRFDQAPPTSMEPARILGLSSAHQAELLTRLLPSSLDLLFVGLELEHWTSLVAGTDSISGDNPLSHNWIQSAVPRIRAAFEKALAVTSNPMLRFGSQLSSLALTLTPTFWTDHLRVVLWSAYMAFEWALAGGATAAVPQMSELDDPCSLNFNAHRKQRVAFKAIFYRAVENLPWAKVLYTELARYCPEDAEEVIELLACKELRLRTYLEEVDLLLTSKVP